MRNLREETREAFVGNRKTFGCVFKKTYRDKKTGEVKESAFYSIAYSPKKGVRKTESTHSTKKEDAEKLLKKRLIERLERRPWMVQKDVTLEKLWADTADQIKKPEQRLRYFKKYCADKGITLAKEVTDTVFMSYAAHRRKTGVSSKPGKTGAAEGTILWELKAVRQAFAIGYETKDAEGVRMLSNVPKWRKGTLKEGKARQNYWTVHQWNQFEPCLRRLDPDVADAVTFLWLMGWRKNEVLRLEWNKHINHFSGCILIEGNELKNKEPYEIPYRKNRHVNALLERRWQITQELERKHGKKIPWVFSRVKYAGRRIVGFNDIWMHALRDAGLETEGPRKLVRHDFVRSAVGRWAKLVDTKTGAQMMNKTERIFIRYLIVGQQEREDGMAAMSVYQTEEQEKAAAQMALTLPFEKRG